MLSRKFYAGTRAYSRPDRFIPAPCLRSSFYVDGVTKKASLTVGCLGFYRVFLNGTELTRGHLSPYVSNLDDYIYYDEYDLNGRLRQGKNVLAFLLGNGLRDNMGGYSWNFHLADWTGAPAVAFCAEFTDDRGEQRLEAGPDMRTHPSPIYQDDLRFGESYDARLEMPGWTLPEFDDSAWLPAVEAPVPRGEGRIGFHAPITVERELKPISIRPSRISKQRYSPDAYVVPYPEDEHVTEGELYDFGENNAGIVRLKIKGAPGQKIILQFGELLTGPERGLNLTNMAYAPIGYDHRIVYICKGDPDGEEYTPSFTYFGFRYVLAMGLTQDQVVPETLTALIMHTKTGVRGGVDSSCDMVNKLYAASMRANKSNFFHIITDCPHREKNGWTGDISLSAEQMLLSMEPEDNLREWLYNVRKAQREDGLIPDVIPTYKFGFHGALNPLWNKVLMDVPYFILKYRGTLDTARENADAIFRLCDLFVRLMEQDKDGLIPHGFGDWCPFGRLFFDFPTDPVVTSTFGVMEALEHAAVLFDALDMKARARFVKDARRRLKQNADRRLVNHETHRVLGDTQTGQAMGIAVGMFPADEEQAAADELARLIHENDDLLTIGCIGSRYVYEVLSSHGYETLALETLITDRFPSMGYAVAHCDDTSLPECMWPVDHEGDPGSKNHHFFGDFSGWFIRELGGLKVNPGMRDVNEIAVVPRFPAQLSRFTCYHILPAGRVDITWERTEGGITLTLTVPDEVHGILRLPGKDPVPAVSGTYRF